MGMWGQVPGEVQGKEAAGRNAEEVVRGIEGATWSKGACTRGGARKASYVSFLSLFLLSQIHYTFWDFSPKITNSFGMNIPKLLMFLGLSFPKLLMFFWDCHSQNY